MMERMKNDVFIVSIDDWLKLNTNGKSIYTQLRLTPGSRFYRVRAVNELEEGSDPIKNYKQE